LNHLQEIGKRRTMLSLIALTDSNTLASFDPANPGQVTSVAVSGVDSPLLGIDTRPANGLIYGITTTDNIYTIDPTSGVATFVSTLSQPFNAAGISGFDFNPAADRLRLVGDNDQNFRINVDTGAVTVDSTLAYATGDVNAGVDPSIAAAAYTNAFGGTTTTQLYNIDALQDVLVLQNPPNNGTLMTIGALGVDFGTLTGFDIVSSPDGSNTAWAVSNSTLYSIDLSTGAASSRGAIGTNPGVNFQGLASIPSSVLIIDDDTDKLLNGRDGNDAIAGLGGNDTLNGGMGADTLFGNKQNDLIDGGSGNDMLFGGMDNDTISGRDGNDVIAGNIGTDRLMGEAGNDMLFGGMNNDSLSGGEGSDILSGDLGDDTLTGGAGGDRFDVRAGDGIDIVTDFQDGFDLIGPGGGLTFAQLSIIQSGNDTQITATGLSVTLVGVNVGLITAADFAAV
jgi:Ca2+-binding RTX toxin-like protein